jgi:hypothetical protein
LGSLAANKGRELQVRGYWIFGQESRALEENEKTFGEITLEDFAAFDAAGLSHPDLPG